MGFLNLKSPFFKNVLAIPDTGTPAATAALTGTALTSITEADIVTGGKTIIITLSNDTWVTSGATFDAQRQNIINGLDSAQAEGTGWNAVVQATQAVGGVVRTSDTVVTITLDAFATYNITATETITVTVPSTAVTLAGAIVATPTFDITAAGAPSTGAPNWPILNGLKFWSPRFS
jgi:hypothetical protein